jgi:hypothetical protein
MTKPAHKQNLEDLGVVTNLSIGQDAGGPGTLILTLEDERAIHQVFRLTDGGAKGLWYALTRLIHPLATGPLTPVRSDTPGMANSLFTILAARVRRCQNGSLIELEAISAVNGFTARFTVEEGEQLWLALEGIYSAASSGHSEQRPL